MSTIKETTPIAGKQSESKNQAIRVLYTRALENISKLAKKSSVLRDSCEKLLADIKKQESMKLDVIQDMTNNPNKYFAPLKMACETKTTQLVDAALDCLQKLMNYGLIDDKKKYDADNSLSMLDITVQTVCRCFELNQDDTVQIQVLKAVLAAISCKISGHSLQLVLKTCFVLYLLSKNAINSATARGAIEQVLDLVFANVEKNMDEEEDLADDDEMSSDDALTDQQILEEEKPTRAPGLSVPAIPRSGSTSTLNESGEESPNISSKNRSFSFENLSAKQQTDPIGKFIGELFFTQTSKEVHVQGVKTTGTFIENPFRRDAVDTIKELCQLSIKKLPQGSNNIDNSIEMRTRITSMQMMASVLENTGQKFRASKSLLRCMRNYICRAILVNALATHSALFDQALSLLKIILKSYKQHFRNEIVIFLTDVLLRLANSPNSTYQQKLSIATMLQTLMNDPQFPVDLFVNYDCSPSHSNGLEKTVEGISQSIRNIRAEANWLTAQQEVNIKLLQLQSIVGFLNTLIELHKKRLKEDGRMDTRSREFENLRKKKVDLRDGIAMFNQKSAKKGIDYLIRTGHLNKDPMEVARFLQRPGLDRTTTNIGDYISERDEFNAKVLREWVRFQDFSGMDFEQAFRRFLTTLVLPKEAQKIDRIVDAWAELYSEQNKNNAMFKDAGITHVFACFMLLLNTQLHNPNLANTSRMDLNQFVDNARNISEDFSREYLSKLYNNIKQNEIKPAEIDPNFERDQSPTLELQVSSNVPLMKRKQQAYERETSSIIRQVKSALADNKNTEEFIENAHGVYHIASMWEITWKSVLTCIDYLFDLVIDDKQFIQLCLRVFECSVVISGRYENDEARIAFIGCLAKYCSLFFVPSELRLLQKNIDCIKLLTRLADIEGNYIKDSWEHVINLLSQLEFLIESQKGARGEYNKQLLQIEKAQKLVEQLQKQQDQNQQNNFISDINSRLKIGRDNQITIAFAPIGNEEYLNLDKVLSLVEERSGGTNKSRLIDNIFIKTAELSDDALVEFIKALCAVSLREELNGGPPIKQPLISQTINSSSTGVKDGSQLAPSTSGSNSLITQLQEICAQYEPRTFLMQKITEVSFYNVNRKDKFVWAPIWLYISEYFVSVGCHRNLEIAKRGTDSLRNLVQSFMDHEELLYSLPNFQAALIQPFLRIAQQNKLPAIREIVVDCVGRIVNTQYKAISNGWRTVLDLFSFVATQSDSDVRILEVTFNPLTNLVSRQDCFNLVCESRSFVELINCLIYFAKNQQKPELSKEAVDNIAKCTAKLGTGVLSGLRTNKGDTIIFTDSSQDTSLWLPILRGLCSLITDDVRLDIRRHSRNTMFNLLKEYGSKFDASLWKLIFEKLLCPLFDNILPSETKTQTEVKKQEDAFVRPVNRYKGLANDAYIQETKEVKKEEEVKPIEIVIERTVITMDSLWVRTTCEPALLDVINLLNHFYTVVPFAFKDVMKLISTCFRQENGNKVTLSSRLLKIGTTALTRLVELGTNKLIDDHWTQITNLLNKLITIDMNAAIGIEVPLPTNVKDAENRLLYMNMQGTIHQSLVQQVQQVLTSQLSRPDTTISVDHIASLMVTLKSAYLTAKSVNESELMTTKKGAGLPSKMFLDQETLAVGNYLSLLFRMLFPETTSSPALRKKCLDLAESLVVPISSETLQRYLAKADIIEATEEYRSVNSSEMIEMIPIVVQVLNGVLECSDVQFMRYMDALYESLSNLVLSEHRVIRTALRNVFIRYKNLKR